METPLVHALRCLRKTAASPAGHVAREGGNGVARWLGARAVPIGLGIGTGVAGKRLYDDVTFAEENRQAGVRV